MCLSSVKETYSNPSSVITDGWKEFTSSVGKLFFHTYGLDGGFDDAAREVPMDKWIKAAEISVTAGDYKQYTSGFHVYTNGKNAAGVSRRRVYIRRVKAKGLQGDEECLIANEMYVPSDPNGWPPKNGEPAKLGNKAKVLELIEKLKDVITGGNA